jgi:hypothetical protein
MTDKEVASVRKAILDEMARRKLTTYQLWKMVEDSMSKPTVYDFLSGEKALTSDNLDQILHALDLRVARRR